MLEMALVHWPLSELTSWEKKAGAPVPVYLTVSYAPREATVDLRALFSKECFCINTIQKVKLKHESFPCKISTFSFFFSQFGQFSGSMIPKLELTPHQGSLFALCLKSLCFLAAVKTETSKPITLWRETPQSIPTP